MYLKWGICIRIRITRDNPVKAEERFGCEDPLSSRDITKSLKRRERRLMKKDGSIAEMLDYGPQKEHFKLLIERRTFSSSHREVRTRQ
jgi:hypothetical protein